MSESLCVGVCMFDPDSGACMGCGRSAEEIAGAEPAPAAADTEQSPAGGHAEMDERDGRRA